MSDESEPGQADAEEAVPEPASSPEAEEVLASRRRKIEALKQELVGGDLFTAAEVAEILDIHPRTVGEYIRGGVLKAHQFGGGWKISENALRAFVRDQSEPRPVSAPGPWPPKPVPPKAERPAPAGGLPWRRGPRSGFRCSFCGKSQEQVRRLIAGPNVLICDECVGLCNQIISEEFGSPAPAR